MSPANTNSDRVSDSQPREVMNVAVLAESELGSEAQRERRKRILDATMAIASKGGYEAVQMRAVADRAAEGSLLARPAHLTARIAIVGSATDTEKGCPRDQDAGPKDVIHLTPRV